MPEQPSRIVIIGASLGGASAALALREQGFAGEITLIGNERHLPYERPPLSKAILLGNADEPDWVGSADDFAAKDITLVLGTEATAIDRDAHTVTAGDQTYPYDKLVLATGSSPRRLNIPGADLPGVVTLRTLDDSLALREQLTDGTRLVIVGAGWIGCEVAAAAREHGVSVVMLDPLAQPLVRVLGEEVGRVFADLHREHGVDLRLGTGVIGIAEDGAALSVRFEGGEAPADLVLLGVGAAPNLALAEAAGLELAAGGIAVDAGLQTSDPDIYAVGDIAAHAHPAYSDRVRVEHWANAKEQGGHVAANLLGGRNPYDLRPFFFSDQYDLGCEYRGLADPEHDDLVIKGDVGKREFVAYWLRGGVLVAALNVNVWDYGDDIDALISSGRTVSPDELPSP